VYAKQYPKHPGAIPSWPMVYERSSPSREASPRLGGAPLTAPGRSETMGQEGMAQDESAPTRESENRPGIAGAKFEKVLARIVRRYTL
jgi:hypothetical protein